ncbi:hypothetical protein FA95DRAFT_228614 [Auriscalpium vulgare]|uniref:Uncharacterized protein n=1 Tax=Auriscalpium vulgare TaxID=40419 RepID=A0ACB8RLU1_9AGAM|nr:hypothetical protein FA95DRAFT_228614 [Auriscalpium vulgare]
MQPIVPLDVQFTVIEWVYRSSQHWDVDYQTLCACAVVCKAWAPIAQRMLFRRLPTFAPLSMRGHVHQLIHCLRANPRLASYVCSVHISFLFSTSEEHWSLLLLDHCPQVRSITFEDVISNLSWTTALENRLRALPINPISLEILGDANNVMRIAPLWPSVQVLSLYSWNNAGDINDDDWDTDTPVRIPVPRSVRSIWIRTDFIPWVLVREHELRDLAFQCPGWSDRAWVASLLASGILPQLRSVDIEGEIPPPDVMAQLTQLRSLIFTDESDWEVVLPQNLCHLGVHCRWRTAALMDQHPEPVGPLIAAVRAAGNLRLLTMLSDAPDRVREMFHEACRDRGIDLAFYEDPEQSPRPENVDWI